tara:strand:- start:120 stop:569 length:450 start_codon:yes stop_codon:yes gene_type:complete
MIMDEKDKEILNILQENGRMTASEISDRIDLSIPTVAERIRKLTEYGFLQEFRAIAGAKKVGYDVTAYILLDMSSASDYDDVVKRSKKNTEVLECHSITGEGSHILKIRTKNTSSLELLLRDIQSWPGVRRTRTMIVMSTIKETTNLPV